jgi:type VII secretion protein EccB
MAQTPTSKAQVQAYRFVLKRIESALVRRDAVMLHDPMRTHLRAATIGLIIAVIGAAGFFMFGLIKPKSALDRDGIVIGKQSGSFYVLDHDPVRRLIPVTNLASARLIMFALGSAGQGDMNPKFVDDSAMANIARTSLAGIPGAPLDIPGEKERVAPKWSVCDRTVPDPAKPQQQREAEAAITTTAVIGYDRVGRPLGDDETLLVQASSGERYLIFDGKRARIDTNKTEIRRAFNLVDATPRVISTGLLNAIPSVDDLKSPEIPGRGQESPLAGSKVGEIVQIIRPGLEPYNVLLRDGYQEIPKAVADLIRFTPGYPGPERIRVLRPADLNNVKNVEDGLNVDTSDFPRDIARPKPLAESTLACLYWAYNKEGNRQDFTVTIADDLRVPGAPQPVKLAQSDGRGDLLDQVLIAAGKGAAVQGTVPAGQAGGTGEIWLVTDQGVRYPVPSVEIASALGIGTQFDPAPQTIMNIMPIGPALDPAEAIRTFDTIDTGDQGSSLNQQGG